jgi:predicted dehydrogenase
MKAVRVGLVGAGFSAGLHLAGLRRVHGVPITVSAVASGSRERANAFARTHGIPDAHAGYASLLADPDIDAVCVCVPNELHERVIIDAARAGKHIICEKPVTAAFVPWDPADRVGRAEAELATALGTADRITEEVAAGGVQFLYAENWLYAPATVKAEKLLATSGGTILDIRAEESHSGSHAARSRHRATAGGGALLTLGTHPIALALYLKRAEGQRRSAAGIRPVAVTCEVSDVSRLTEASAWLVNDWEDVETWASILITFADGATAVVVASFAMLGGVRNTFEAYTPNAAIHVSMTPDETIRSYTPDPDIFGADYLREKVETGAGWQSVSADEDWSRGYPQEMQVFAECLAGLRSSPSDLALARDVIEVVYEGYLSAAQGRRVAVGPGKPY